MNASEVQVYLGTITEPVPFAPGACGAGIVVCALDTRTGRLEQRHVTGGILSPNYLAVDANGRNLFAITCDMEAECHVHAFSRETSGALTPRGFQPTGARVGCHVTVLPDGRVCATSYFDSSIAVFPFREGKLGPREFHVRYTGRSVNPVRQEDSHAHQAVVSPDGRWLYVCDLGADRIWCHAIGSGRVDPASPTSLTIPPGYGPRHLAFHPTLPRAYVINELNAQVLTCAWQSDSGAMTIVSDLPTLPEDWRGQPSAAAIRVHPSGTSVVVSNRNHDSLAFFSLDSRGIPTRTGHIAAGGKGPRDFAIDPTGRWLLAANQDASAVTIHELDPHNGRPARRAPATLAVATPVCVLICAPPEGRSHQP